MQSVSSLETDFETAAPARLLRTNELKKPLEMSLKQDLHWLDRNKTYKEYERQSSKADFQAPSRPTSGYKIGQSTFSRELSIRADETPLQKEQAWLGAMCPIDGTPYCSLGQVEELEIRLPELYVHQAEAARAAKYVKCVAVWDVLYHLPWLQHCSATGPKRRFNSGQQSKSYMQEHRGTLASRQKLLPQRAYSPQSLVEGRFALRQWNLMTSGWLHLIHSSKLCLSPNSQSVFPKQILMKPGALYTAAPKAFRCCCCSKMTLYATWVHAGFLNQLCSCHISATPEATAGAADMLPGR